MTMDRPLTAEQIRLDRIGIGFGGMGRERGMEVGNRCRREAIDDIKQETNTNDDGCDRRWHGQEKVNPQVGVLCFWFWGSSNK